MPLLIDATNLGTTKGWSKFSNNFYYYPASGKDDDNHVHVSTSNGSADPLTIQSVSVKVAGANSNLAVGSGVTQFKFKPGTATWPDDDALTQRYKTALQTAGIIA